MQELTNIANNAMVPDTEQQQSQETFGNTLESIENAPSASLEYLVSIFANVDEEPQEVYDDTFTPLTQKDLEALNQNNIEGCGK